MRFCSDLSVFTVRVRHNEIEQGRVGQAGEKEVPGKDARNLGLSR